MVEAGVSKEVPPAAEPAEESGDGSPATSHSHRQRAFSVTNPTPHLLSTFGSVESPNPVLLDTVGAHTRQRIVVAMVGLPARGKTRVARRIQNYLAFFHGVKCVNVSVGDHRRSICGPFQPAPFFDPHDDESAAKILECREAAMRDILQTLRRDDAGAVVAFFDAHNTTVQERRWCVDQLQDTGCSILFVECASSNEEQVAANMRDVHKFSPEYAGKTLEEAVADLQARTAYVSQTYQPLDYDGSERHLSWIKVTDMDRYEVNNVHGYLLGRITQLVMNLQQGTQSFYLSRHGQSEYNVQGKIGGDAPLTSEGTAYARKLGEFAEKVIAFDAEAGAPRAARLWTSTLRRTRETASFIPHQVIKRRMPQPQGVVSWEQMKRRELPNLDEIYAGVCDGMTYEEIQEEMPEEYELRKRDKLGYRYPRGESYLDVCHRLEPVVMEMERIREPLLVVAHQGILRLIYAYFMGVPREQAPYVSIPLNTVIELTPQTYSCDEKRHLLHTKHAINSDGQAEPASPTPRAVEGLTRTAKVETHAQPLSFESYTVSPPPLLSPGSKARDAAFAMERRHKGELARNSTTILEASLLAAWADDPPSH